MDGVVVVNEIDSRHSRDEKFDRVLETFVDPKLQLVSVLIIFGGVNFLKLSAPRLGPKSTFKVTIPILVRSYIRNKNYMEAPPSFHSRWTRLAGHYSRMNEVLSMPPPAARRGFYQGGQRSSAAGSVPTIN
jgi:hypothetical protein